MPKCENCYHAEICKNYPNTGLPPKMRQELVNKGCEHYKDKSLIIELPCRVGDTVYCVGTECLADRNGVKCEKWKAENPGSDCDECLLDRKYVVFQIQVSPHLIGNIVFNQNENFVFGKTVFLSREEAERALKEREKNGNEMR